MDTIAIRELRRSLAAAVRRAAGGERLVITVDGTPLAQLGPLDPGHAEPTLADLARRGLLSLPRRPDRPDPVATVEPVAGVRLDRVLREVRGR